MARLTLTLFASAALVACSGPSSTAGPSAPAETEISLRVSVTSKNNLRVEGTTNLPDGAVLRVDVSTESGAPLYGMNVSVRGGAYAYEFANATRLPHGPYLVEVRFAHSDQPRASFAGLKEKRARKVCSR